MLSLNLPEGALSESLHAVDIVLLTETIEVSGISSKNGSRILRERI